MVSNPQLELAFNFVEKTSRNLFLTGKAGTGKTTFLHRIKMESFKRMIVVAPTGVAAINAKGVTIHSFFQLPFGPILPNTSRKSSDIQRKFNRTKIDIIKSLDLVIIDEISMVRADVLDGIDKVLKRYKNPQLPFGGVQLVMIGDLQQLSPVVRPDEWNLLKSYYKTAYFFSSLAFQKANVISIELKHIYRQSNEDFIAILNEIRNDQLSETAANSLNRQYQPDFEPKINEGYITLTTHNRKANSINNAELKKLKTKSKTYKAKISGNFYENNYPNDDELLLKINSQVMFIKNDSSPEKKYYNGKIGIVTELNNNSILVKCDDEIIETSFETWENIKYSLDKNSNEISERIDGTYTQIPLRLAWAITIHKSQGLTFEKAIIDAEKSFAHGQVYVALSRCKSLEGIVLKTPIESKSIVNDVTVNHFTNRIKESEPTVNTLNNSKKEFQLFLLSELFDFYTFLRPLRRMSDIYYSNRNSFTGTIAEPLENIKENGIIPLIKIGANFKNQLKKLAENIENPEKSPIIQERYQKAIVYFTEQIKKNIQQPLQILNFSTDNKTVKKDFEKQLDVFEEQLNIKTYCLKNLSDAFSTQKYMELRADAILQKPKKVSKKRDIVTSTSNIELFEELRMLRQIISNSENIPPFQVFTQKTLYEMCETLPTTLKQLKSVHGMGKIRVNKYGDEIIETISEYCKKHNIESQKIRKELKPQKLGTKQITLQHFKKGLSVDEIAKKRELTQGTIEGHLAHFIATNEIDIYDIISTDKVNVALKIIENNKFENLTELRELTGNKYSYNELKMIVSHYKSVDL